MAIAVPLKKPTTGGSELSMAANSAGKIDESMTKVPPSGHPL